MATSTKVMFNLETLREKAIQSIDFRIAQAETRVAAHHDDEALAQLIHEWRAEEKQRILDLASEIKDSDVPDWRLAKFKIEPMPSIDRHERGNAVRELAGLKSLKSKILAKSEAITSDENGNVSLTPTQLKEFFGL